MSTTVRRSQPAVAPKLLRHMNQKLILEVLSETGAMTKPLLAATVGLSQPTVNAACDELLEAGLLVDAGRGQQTTGRPAQKVAANVRAGAVVGVDIGRQWVRTAVSDLVGTTLSVHESRNRTRSAKALVELIVQSVAVAGARVDLGDTTQFVLGSPGVYDEHADRVLLADQLPGWHRPKLPAMLREALGENLLIENDVNLAALGELDSGAAQGAGTFGYLHIGTGLGFAAVVDGKLVRGAHGSAGEIGYLPYGRRADGTVVKLEEKLSAPGLTAVAERKGLDATAPDAVLQAAISGQGAGAEIRDELVEQVATLITMISAMYDPELIVIGGGIGQELGPLASTVVDRVTKTSPFRPRCEIAALRGGAPLRGAVVHGLERARDLAFSSRIPL